MLEAIDRYLGDRVQVTGCWRGCSCCAVVQSTLAETAVLEAAAPRGVGIYGISPYFLTQPSRSGFMLGYSRMKRSGYSARGIHGYASCCNPSCHGSWAIAPVRSRSYFAFATSESSHDDQTAVRHIASEVLDEPTYPLRRSTAPGDGSACHGLPAFRLAVWRKGGGCEPSASRGLGRRLGRGEAKLHLVLTVSS